MTTQKNPSGGSAFPGFDSLQDSGMSLRDWFAGKALVGFASHVVLSELKTDLLAQLAYQQADAMIKRRNK